MWYPQFKYTFKSDDKDYISALINLLPELKIESFSADSKKYPFADKKLQDLDKLIGEVTISKPAA